jgi:site-specific recombinase XerD
MRTFGLIAHRRHTKSCSFTTPTYHPSTAKEVKADTCRCPIVLRGYLKYVPEKIRNLSTSATEWNEALAVKKKLEDLGRLPEETTGEKTLDRVTIKQAVDEFFKKKSDGTGKVADATFELYRVFLNSRLLPWCNENRVEYVADFDILHTTEKFDQSWRNLKSPEKHLGGESRKTTMTVFRTFLKYCVDRDWLKTNTATKIKTSKAQQRHSSKNKKHGLELQDYEKVLRYLDGEPDPRMRTMIELMRWTGMRISDAAKFSERELVRNLRNNGWNADFVAQKNGKECIVPVPEHVAGMLQALPFLHETFWFQTGQANWRSRAQQPGLRIAKIFKATEKEFGAFAHHASAHTLRHTFAIQHLNNDVPIKVVADWMGDNVATVLKHYSHAIRSTQEMQEDASKKSIEQMRKKIEALKA